MKKNWKFALRRGNNFIRDGPGLPRVLIGNRLRQIEWYCLRAPTAIERARNHVRSPLNSSLGVASNGSRVALSVLL